MRLEIVVLRLAVLHCPDAFFGLLERGGVLSVIAVFDSYSLICPLFALMNAYRWLGMPCGVL